MAQLPGKSPLQEFGLHCVQQPRSDMSIVFVHGILSGGQAAWGQPSWPELLANEPEFQDAGVFVFSYQTSLSSGTYSIGDVVDALREHFKLEGLWEQRRLVFVCHSMGGIVVRRFIVVNQVRFIERSYPVGLFLVASPSLGSRDANLTGLLALLRQHAQALAMRFSQTNTWLNDLDKDFINLKESGRLPLVGKELVEDRPIPLRRWFGLRRQIVEPFAGAKYFGEAIKVPGTDHISISKPERSGAVQHQLLKRFIAEFNEFVANAELRWGIESIQENLDRFEEIRPVMNQLIGWPYSRKPHAVTHRLSADGNAVEFVGYGEIKKVTIDDLKKLPRDDRRAIAASNSAMRKLITDWNAVVKKGQLSTADDEELFRIASQMNDRLELIFQIVETTMGGMLQDHYGAQRAIARHASERYAQLQAQHKTPAGH
jgi:hypothetical protein